MRKLIKLFLFSICLSGSVPLVWAGDSPTCEKPKAHENPKIDYLDLLGSSFSTPAGQGPGCGETMQYHATGSSYPKFDFSEFPIGNIVIVQPSPCPDPQSIENLALLAQAHEFCRDRAEEIEGAGLVDELIEAAYNAAHAAAYAQCIANLEGLLPSCPNLFCGEESAGVPSCRPYNLPEWGEEFSCSPVQEPVIEFTSRFVTVSALYTSDGVCLAQCQFERMGTIEPAIYKGTGLMGCTECLPRASKP